MKHRAGFFIAVTIAGFAATPSAAGENNIENSRWSRLIVVNQHRVVCGQTGCFDVKPGCGYEMRRSGRGGTVAVVTCDQNEIRRWTQQQPR
jgi:hypothetical protein